MPPPKANIDGVSRNPLPLSPAVENRPADNAAPIANSDKKKGPPTSKVKTSSLPAGPKVVISLTVVIMVLLIALAYLAYTKSR